jgi:rod shape determining protein RodA
MSFSFHKKEELSLLGKLVRVNWLLLLLLGTLAFLGFITLYSAAGGNYEPWAYKHGMRFIFCAFLLLAVGLTNIRIIYDLAYPLYFLSLVLLISVLFFPSDTSSADRWISVAGFNFQPSELIKITMVLALARFFNGVQLQNLSIFKHLFLPTFFIIFFPVLIILFQPDLGTAVIILLTSVVILWIAGIKKIFFILTGFIFFAVTPYIWNFMLHDYQKNRILTFLNPQNDPLGSGYHIIQSKIALGSGSFWGKGFLKGTQSQLNFLPEKHTDFVFTTFGEEFGFAGSLFLLIVYFIIFSISFYIAIKSRNYFGRLLAIGLAWGFFINFAINIAMVIGLVPVVGAPLPLMSYGGSSMLSTMLGFGLLTCVYVHKEVEISKSSDL